MSVERHPEQIARDYLARIARLVGELDTGAVATVMEWLDEARRQERTVFIAGNGGSASTASHMATDLGYGTRRGIDGRSLRTLSLTDNQALITAAANDEGYPNVFVSQLRGLYRPGDLLIVISASGNSPNVIQAARWVREQGGKVIGLLGFDGGQLLSLCHAALHVKTPVGEYGPVEDVHVVLNHLLAAWLRLRMAQESAVAAHAVRGEAAR